MELDEDKPIDVQVEVRINQRLLLISLLSLVGSILLTGVVLYFFASGFIPTISSILIGVTLVFFSLYFPMRSHRFFQTQSKIIDIEQEEYEELQSVMKPW